VYIVVDTVRYGIAHAELDVYHEAADEADWNLRCTTDGGVVKFPMSGTVMTPWLPGPSRLMPHDFDEDLTVDGTPGIVYAEDTEALTATAERDMVRITGTLVLVWSPSQGEERPYEVTVDVAATYRRADGPAPWYHQP
jgi:hypothetical protein